MIRAVLFDLDGTLVNTEPLHFAAFNEVLAPLGIRIDRQDYFTRLIGYDDRGCFETVLRENGVEPEPENIAELIRNKSDHYLEMVARSTDLLYPRAAEIVAACGERFPLMLVTGTLRKEAELILKGCGLRSKFVDVIAADDVE